VKFTNLEVTYEISSILSVFGGIRLSAAENTDKVVVCVFWLFENL